MQAAQGDLAGALAAYRREPGDRRAPGRRRPEQRRLAARSLGEPTTRSATCKAAQGDLAGALAAYAREPGDPRAPGRPDPSNAGWQRDLSVSLEQGRRRARRRRATWRARSQPTRDSLAIRERLADAGPEQRRLAARSLGEPGEGRRHQGGAGRLGGRGRRLRREQSDPRAPGRLRPEQRPVAERFGRLAVEAEPGRGWLSRSRQSGT